MGAPGATRCVATGRGTKNPGSNTTPPESGNEKTPLTGASSFRGEWGIRTPEGFHPTNFPSWRHRPLGEFSEGEFSPKSALETKNS